MVKDIEVTKTVISCRTLSTESRKQDKLKKGTKKRTKKRDRSIILQSTYFKQSGEVDR